MTNLDDIKRKLAAILAKAEDGSGATEEEANSALEFARRLMLRHQLTEADLASTKDRTPQEIAADTEYTQRTAYGQSARMAAWEVSLAYAIQLTIGTVGWYQANAAQKRTATGNLEFDAKGQPFNRSRFVWYGPAEDCRDAAELLDEWSVLIASLARMKWGGAFRGKGRSYAEGFASALQEKARERDQAERALISGAPRGSAKDAAMVARSEAQGGACSALVVQAARDVMLAKKNAGKAWLSTQGVRLTTSSSGGGGSRNGDAYAAGRRDGRNANLSHSSTRKIGGPSR